MKKVRFFCTLWIIKLVIALMKMIGKQATHLPGLIGLTLYKDIYGHLEMPSKIIAVTGTNGKTTTANIIGDILSANGINFIHNRDGGNIAEGLLCAIAKSTSVTGRIKKDLAVFEIDERSANRVFPYMKPTYLAVTNLSQDSYQRNAHPFFIFDILEKYIPDETTLILNGDDLISSRLKPENERKYFGIEPMMGEKQVKNIQNDLRVCPECDTELDYTFVRYNHIGRAKCPECGYENPSLDFRAVGKSMDEKSLNIRTPEGNETYKIINDNITNIYNLTTAIAVLRTYGLTEKQISNALENIKITESRTYEEVINNIAFIDQLSKAMNPIAASNAFNMIRTAPGKKAVVLYLQVYYKDPRIENLSWLYATDFEFLNHPDIIQIVLAGTHCNEFLVRLLMAGVSKDIIICCEDETKVDEVLDLSEIERVYTLHGVHYHNENIRKMREKIKNKRVILKKAKNLDSTEKSSKSGSIKKSNPAAEPLAAGTINADTAVQKTSVVEETIAANTEAIMANIPQKNIDEVTEGNMETAERTDIL